MEGAEKPPGPDHPPNAETMKEDWKLLLFIALTVVILFALGCAVMLLAKFLAARYGFVAGALTLMLPILALVVGLIYYIIKADDEDDFAHRN